MVWSSHLVGVGLGNGYARLEVSRQTEGNKMAGAWRGVGTVMDGNGGRRAREADPWYGWVGYGPGTLKTDFCWNPHRTRACGRLRRCSAGRGGVPARDSSRLWKSWWLGAGELS